MDVLQSAQHIVVDGKLDPGEELGAFLDGERLVLERLEGVAAGEVQRDVGSAWCLNGQGFDDAFARVVGVANRFAGVKAQRSLPSVEGLVVLVCFD